MVRQMMIGQTNSWLRLGRGQRLRLPPAQRERTGVRHTGVGKLTKHLPRPGLGDRKRH